MGPRVARIGPAHASALLFLCGFACATASSCSQYTNCTECNSQPYFCHWCPDKKCHALGSISGCLKSPSCTGISECQRDSPEFIGYGHASGAAIFAGCFAIVFALVCCFSCGNVLRLWRESKGFDVQRSDIRYQELLLRGEGGAVPSPGGDDGWRHVPTETQRIRPLWAARISYAANACCALLTLAFIALTATYMVVSPEVPSYAICTHEVELRSLFASLAKFHPNAAYDVLLSVHNPNRLDIQLEEAEATLSYKGDPVGTWRLEKPRNFPAGTVVDLVAVLRFSPSTSQAIAMYSDVKADDLYLSVDATGTVDLEIGGVAAFTKSSSVHVPPLRVGAPGDLSLCKCGKAYASQ